MFLWDWISGMLNFLGLAKKSGKLVFLGLDNAGKTTLLHMLKDDKLAQHVPTLHPTSEELTLGNINFTTFDLGGHAQVRRVWKDYFPAIDAIVFLVDVWDRQRFHESANELECILNDEQLINCPILVLGNKIDKHGAAGEDEIRNIFKLFGRTTGKICWLEDNSLGENLKSINLTIGAITKITKKLKTRSSSSSSSQPGFLSSFANTTPLDQFYLSDAEHVQNQNDDLSPNMMSSERSTSPPPSKKTRRRAPNKLDDVEYVPSKNGVDWYLTNTQKGGFKLISCGFGYTVDKPSIKELLAIPNQPVFWRCDIAGCHGRAKSKGLKPPLMETIGHDTHELDHEKLNKARSKYRVA